MPKNTNNLFGNDLLSSAAQFNGNIINDIYDLFQAKEGDSLNMARNAVSLSPIGDMYTISNEMSNKLVAEAPYTIIGTIYITNGQWAIFSTDDINSEIGIFDEHKLSYERFVNSKELNFKKSNLIKGVGRIKQFCHRKLYWDDDLNPSRCIDLDDIPWCGKWVKNYSNNDCLDFEYENDYNCIYQDKNNSNNINTIYRRLNVKKILLSLTTENGLSFKLSKGDKAGELLNGTYVVLGYYSHGGSSNPITNYYTLSNAQPLFNHINVSGSLEVDITSIDDTFEEYTLVLVQFERLNYSFKIIGTYSTDVKHITITQIDNKLPNVINYNQFFTDLSFPEKTAGIYKVGNYLTRIKPTRHQDFNYQLLANNIKTNWISISYDQDYYKNGGNNIGYMRDEVYSFFIRWVYNTGDKSKSYHIPGREEGAYQDATNNIEELDGIKVGDTIDGGTVEQIGKMAYWESTEKYEDKKPEVWGDLCGKSIRHHKMPNNSISPHFSDGKIHVLGVHFSNIQRPTQKVKKIHNDGTYEWIDKEIDNIIGYEILRGSRTGNKSIIAKGIINNMRSYNEYTIDGSLSREIYYPNYPYNSMKTEKFLTSKMLMHSSLKKVDQCEASDGNRGNTCYLKQFNGESEIPYETKEHLSLTKFTFHSPELIGSHNSMESPAYLSAKELVVYGSVKGKMEDIMFNIPKGAPRQKLLNNTGLLSAVIIGLGYAILKMHGRKKTITKSPMIDYGPTMASAGTVEMSTGVDGVSAPAAIKNSGIVTASEATRIIYNTAAEQAKTISAAAGSDADATAQVGSQAESMIAGVTSGKSGQAETETEATEWKDIPSILRVFASVPIFLTYWAQGMNNLIEMMYSFAQYRNFVLQQMSHGNYNQWKEDNVRTYNIDNQTYLDRSTLTKMADGTIVNNIHRNKSIAISIGDSKGINTDSTENSQILFSKYNLNNDIQNKGVDIQSPYVALKQELPSQYGQLRSIKQVVITDKIIPLEESNSFANTENILFGGDTFIARYTEKNTMFFFYNWLNGEPDGTQFDYSLYQMNAHSRFWMDTTPYDIENITEVVGSLFTKNKFTDFEPFNLNQRYSSSGFILEDSDGNVQLQNFETNFDTRFTDIYPEVVQYTYKNAKENKLAELNSEIESGLTDEELQKEKDRIEEKSESYAIDEANDVLATFNGQRNCDCNYKVILDQKERLTYSDKIRSEFYKLREKEYNYNEDNDVDEDIDENVVFTKTNTLYGKEFAYNESSKDEQENNIIYNRNNKYSLINCEFFKYRLNDKLSETGESYVKNLYDGSLKEVKEEYIDDIKEREGENTEVNFKASLKKQSTSKKIWYDKPYRLGISDYNSLCKLKDKQDAAELKYAIGLGYIKFLQMYDIDDEDEDWDEEYATLCWFKSKNSKWHDKALEAYDVYDDPWTDDKEGFVRKKNTDGNKYLIGSYDDVPYIMDPNRLNPLLAYFIQEETDIRLNYPDFDELNDDWKKQGLTYDTDYDYCFKKLDSGDYEFDQKRIFNSFDTWGISLCLMEDEDDNEYYGYAYDSSNELRKINYMEAKRIVYNLGNVTQEEEDEESSVETKEQLSIDISTTIASEVVGKDTDYDLANYINISSVNRTFNYKFDYVLVKTRSKYHVTPATQDVEEWDFDYYSYRKTEGYTLTIDGVNYYTCQLNKCIDGEDSYTTGGAFGSAYVLYFTPESYAKYVELTAQKEEEDKKEREKESEKLLKYKTVDVNIFMTAFDKLQEISYDKSFTKDDDCYKYWTINGCRDILKLPKLKKKSDDQIGNRYELRRGGAQADYSAYVTRAEKCNQVIKYFSEKGVLYRKVKRLYKQQEKATKAYNKALNKLMKSYNKTLKGVNSNSFMQKIKTAINKLTPGSYYALDYVPGGEAYWRKSKAENTLTKFNMFVHDAYMYTFVSGVRDFFVETTKNIGARDWGESAEKQIYDHSRFTDMKALFDTDIIKYDNFLKLDESLVPDNLFYNEGFSTRGIMQNMLYDPIEEAECKQRLEKRILYSTPMIDTDITDGWRVFRGNDKFDFDDEITTVLNMTEDGSLILFKNSSPITFANKVNFEQDQADNSITVGTGLLFSSQNMSRLSAFNSFEASSCQDSLSAINTPMGIFYTSTDQGKVFDFEGKNPVDLTTIKSGLTQWFKKFMPIILVKDKQVFANVKFELFDNPVIGVGVQSSYDNANSVLYISKKDYEIKKQYKDQLLYDGNGKFHLKQHGILNGSITLGDNKYFNDASFTISLDLKKGENGWMSYHDWHQDLSMSSIDRIYTTKDNGIWRHNDSAMSYCNFYGKQYPFEVEFKISTENEISTLKSVSYFLETFIYNSDNEYDRFHTLYDNFDKAIIYNTEQNSGLLNLIHQDDNDPLMSTEYPKINKDSIDILWSKEEQRYRFNQFWDITKDRMDKDFNTMFLTQPNGYIRDINPKYVDYMKDDFERKKFRHKVNNVKLIKTDSGNINFVFSINVNMNQKSYR